MRPGSGPATQSVYTEVGEKKMLCVPSSHKLWSLVVSVTLDILLHFTKPLFLTVKWLWYLTAKW